MMIRFPTELVDERQVSEAAVFFTEALAKLNARQFAREPGSDALPCCAKCAGCKLDEGAALQDAKRLLETHEGHPASIVAYSMGRELARGVPCRVVLIEGERLAYERDDGTVADPVAKFLPPHEKAGCACGKHEHESE
jgi:hypothetical protein